MGNVTYKNSGADQQAIMDLVKDYIKLDASENEKQNADKMLADPDEYFEFKEVSDGIEILRK